MISTITSQDIFKIVNQLKNKERINECLDKVEAMIDVVSMILRREKSLETIKISL